MEDLLEQLIHGLTLGSMYAMVAAGLALMFGVVRLINFAHGEFFMLGAYAFWFAYRAVGLPYPVAGLVAAVVMGGFGIVYERTVIRSILDRSWHVQLIATLAGGAAALVTPLFSIFPDMGALLTLKAFAAVIVGGFGYVQGAIAASFLIGVTESLAAGYISYAYKDAIAFVIMIAVLLWRPQGLFGRRIGV